MACEIYYYRQPAQLPVKIKQRATWRFTSNGIYTDKARTTYLDLTGYTGVAEIRNKNTGALVVAITVTPVTLSQGKFTLSLTAAQTDTLPLNTDLMYDVFFDKASPEDKMCIMQGPVFVEVNYTA